MLTSGEITAMRDVCEDAFPDTCTIKRNAPNYNGLGGRTNTFTTLASGVACRMTPMSGDESLFAGASRHQALWRLDLPYNTDIRATDRVTIGSATYDVVHVSITRSWNLSDMVYMAINTDADD
jgi:SPP1 family predicted phage head-tail adaptor